MSHSDYPQQRQATAMSDELISLLRYRIAIRYYDQPHVIEAIARAIAGARAYVIAWP
jgi:hypothetical protein